MTYEKMKEEVKDASLVLVGLGEELTGELSGFYKELAELLKNKDYFIVTLKDREGLEKAGLQKDQITAPVEEPDNQESWDQCVLELGVGFAHPNLIRFPFEKTVYFNKKARYIRVSEKFPQLSAEIADRGETVKEDPVTLFVK